MNFDEERGTTVLHRTTRHKPRKTIQTWLIGRPLRTADAPHQTIGKLIGLATFSSDAMSSVAYGPQEMMTILALAGMGALKLAWPISISIVGLLVLLTISYEQTIHAYPSGGGAYIVSRDNLGELPALIAGAALLTDYILTVSVSISSGVANISSAFQFLLPYKVHLSVLFIMVVMLMNLRGIKESGVVFAIPTYVFIVLMVITIIIGLVRYFMGTLGVVSNPPHLEQDILQPVSVFLILRAFANGTSALTGVEAISNGITAFKEPRTKNAGKTLVIMAVILGSLMLGISFLATHIEAVPSESETIVSQLARTVYGSQLNVFDLPGILSTTVLLFTMLILILAANTAFADFPRLGAMVAADGFLPRQLAFRGSRLVYSYGIVALAVISSILVILFKASVTALIPLYAIGVFLSFTLSQSGMAHRWWKSGRLPQGGSLQERGSLLHHDQHWFIKMIINGVGAVATAVVTVIFAVTKFNEGAWIIIIVIPLLVWMFSAIHRHYKSLAGKLSLENFGSLPNLSRNRVIIPIAGVHKGVLAAVRYAKTLSKDITAVHISMDEAESERVREKWEIWGEGIRLVILESPFRLMIEPLIDYVNEIDSHLKPNETITILVPQFISHNLGSKLLHTNTAETLRKVLLQKSEIVIVEVPYQVE